MKWIQRGKGRKLYAIKDTAQENCRSRFGDAFKREFDLDKQINRDVRGEKLWSPCTEARIRAGGDKILSTFNNISQS
jgi:hypothetical protein